MQYLRKSVAVDYRADCVVLNHAFWSLQLPHRWVSATPGLEQFLSGCAPTSVVATHSPEVTDVLFLFQAAGLLTVPHKNAYSLREVKDLFEPLCTTWHARYYSHPVWKRLRGGELSRNAFVAWVLHNYHLSRSAGITAARCATRCERPDIRRVFLESAIEEYPHCEQYYLIDDPRLGLSRTQVEEYVPLASSLAFDQQMLRLAEEDWLAHVLAGYLQESTASYFDQCSIFYQEVEKRYGLDGFFSSWKSHICLDLAYGHANAFASALDREELLASSQVETSLQNVLVVAQLLVQALDDIVLQDRNDERVVLRRPVTGLKESLRDNALLTSYKPKPESWDLSHCRTMADLLKVMEQTGILWPQCLERRPLTEPEQTFLECEMATALCRGLSYTRGHQAVLRFGRLVERAAKRIAQRADASTWSVPSSWAAKIANFLKELAIQPLELIALLRHYCACSERLGVGIPFLASLEAIQDIEQLLSSYPLDANRLVSVVLLILQFNELWASVGEEGFQNLEVDIFR